MTNTGGLWILFLLLSLVLACLAVTGFLLAVRLWSRRWTHDPGVRLQRIRIGVAIVAVGLSGLSWLAALVFITPSGIVERLGRPNLVLVGLLVGYTAPAVVGGDVLRDHYTTTRTAET